MTFGDTLRDGERLARLMEHLPLIIHAKHLSFTFTGNVYWLFIMAWSEYFAFNKISLTAEYSLYRIV